MEKVRLFLPLYWHHIKKEISNIDTSSEEYQQNKLNLMISLKIVTDFVVKFNILNSESIMNNTSTDESTDYNSDAFM